MKPSFKHTSVFYGESMIEVLKALYPDFNWKLNDIMDDSFGLRGLVFGPSQGVATNQWGINPIYTFSVLSDNNS